MELPNKNSGFESDDKPLPGFYFLRANFNDRLGGAVLASLISDSRLIIAHAIRLALGLRCSTISDRLTPDGLLIIRPRP